MRWYMQSEIIVPPALPIGLLSAGRAFAVITAVLVVDEGGGCARAHCEDELTRREPLCRQGRALARAAAVS